jgi:hypothetical protein
MHGRSLHARTSLVVTAVVAALVALPAATAASPQVIHVKFADSFADQDFCGSGSTVNASFTGHATIWLAPNQAIDTKNNSESDGLFTNPANGATVLTHSAYQFTGTLLTGDPSGVHTYRWTFKGGAEIIRVPNGGVLARDAGNLVVEATFDGDEFVGVQVVSDRGHHPEFGNDCNVLAPALGLS